MTDRELLELAAKAAGITGFSGEDWNGAYFCTPADSNVVRSEPVIYHWLNDDGDALRLAMKLGFVLDMRYQEGPMREFNEVAFWIDPSYSKSIKFGPHETSDSASLARRMIVRAAAEVGAAKP